MDSLTFLERLDKARPQPFYVLHGDEEFLKRQVKLGLRRLILGSSDDDFALSNLSGDKATLAEVLTELQTLPFLAPRRLVVVEQAEPFVTRERAKLEKLFAELKDKTNPTGVLVLEVSTWPANTKLARATPDVASISCKAPASVQLPQWCVTWCLQAHGKQLTQAAAKLLVDLVGPEMGILDKELEKLAVYVGSAPKIEARDVDVLVGQSRVESAWQVFELIGKGQSGEALSFVQRLFDQGEDPLRLLGAFSLQLRRLAQAARLNAQGVGLQESLTRAGIPNFPAARQSAEQQMRYLGRRRLDRLYDWLLETDAGMKGGSQLPPTTLLERLVVRLARPRT